MIGAPAFGLWKAMAAKRVASSVISGEDPSLNAAIVAAFSQKGGVAPVSLSADLPKEHILETKDLGQISASSPHLQHNLVLERYVDSKYLGHGNLDDALASLKAGVLSFDSFVLAMVDVIDSLTLGVFKPKLLEIKINPHVKAREVIYRAEVKYDLPEETHNSKVEGDKTVEESSITNRRITEVSKIAFEISPDAFYKDGLCLADAAQKVGDLNLADRTIIYSRLDELTQRDIAAFAQGNIKEVKQSSQRVRSAVTIGNNPESRDIDVISANGGVIIDDREQIHTELTAEGTPKEENLSALPKEDIKAIGIHENGDNQLSNSQKIIITATQDKSIDHLTNDVKNASSLDENIQTKQSISSNDQRINWTHDVDRVRSYEGEVDLFELDTVSAERFIEEGGALISDKAKIQDIVVAIDFSDLGNTVTVLGNDTRKSWLIREHNITRSQSVAKEKQTVRIATQLAEYDYLSNARSLVSSKIEDINEIREAKKDIVETRSHWKVFGWNTSGFLGENKETAVTPTITTSKTTKIYELGDGDNIFASFSDTQEELTAKGAVLADKKNDTNIEHLNTEREFDFSEGMISYVPFVGGISHLASKAGLGGQVTLSDAFWAAADVAEIVTTAIAIVAAVPTGGTSISAQVAATSAKTAAKVAAKATAKALAKTTAKSLTKVTTKTVAKITAKQVARATAKQVARTTAKQVAKTTGRIAIKKTGGSIGESVLKHGVRSATRNTLNATAKRGGKAVVSGAIKVSGKNTATIATKTSAHQIASQSGKISIKGGQAGAKATAKTSGSIIRYKNIPKGPWSGVPGDSTLLPNPKDIPKNFNPKNKTWGKILAENKIDGIKYKKGIPDLKPVSRGTVKIDNYTLTRSRNFAQADSKLADLYTKAQVNGRSWTKGDIANLRRSSGLTWHERIDMKTLDLVPSEIHGNITHRGGISELKQIISVQ